MTVAGLRRSVAVDDHSTNFRTSQQSVFKRTGAELRESGSHCQLTGRGTDSAEELRASEDGWAACEHQWQWSDEVYTVPVRDVKSSPVQDACYEASSSEVAMRSLRPQLCSAVCPTVSTLTTRNSDTPLSFCIRSMSLFLHIAKFFCPWQRNVFIDLTNASRGNFEYQNVYFVVARIFFSDREITFAQLPNLYKYCSYPMQKLYSNCG